MAIQETRSSRKMVFVLMLALTVLVVAALVVVSCSSSETTTTAAPPTTAAQTPTTAAQTPTTVAQGAGAPSDITCTECHNDGSLLTGKVTAWEGTLHGSGTATAYAGGRAGCAGCHSGASFSAAVAAGTNPGEYEPGDPDPTRQDCRACHEIHTTYTGADWALETTDAAAIYAFPGTTFDGGEGNLCAGCHQPRRPFEAENGVVNVSSTHWGPHHGPQAAMLLGIAGAGATTGNAGPHYSMVQDTCVSCHMGEGASHTFAPAIAACVSCHADAEDFDIGGTQTEVQGLLDQLKAALLAKGMLEEITEEGETLIEPVVGEYPEAEAAALWNWIYIAVEDGSLGVHNPSYTKALLQDSLAALGGGGES